jgi:hypothetical protein
MKSDWLSNSGRLRSSLLSTALLVACGCAIPPKVEPGDTRATDGGVQPSGQVSQATGRTSELFSRVPQRLVVDFKVHRFSAPEGTFTKNDGLWKIITSATGDARMTLRLSDNGFRAAVGRESDRSALTRWLEGVEDVRIALDEATPDASKSVEIEVGPCPARQTVFYYDRQGVLHGLDFVDAKARFRLSFAMHSSNLREVRLELVPELEEPPGPPKWVITDDGARQQPVERRHPFEELTVSAAISENGFLLLGPTAEVGTRHSLAAKPFFIEETPRADGTMSIRESVYIISPIIRVYASQNR